METYALVRVSDHPCSKIRKNFCTHVCYIQRTYIFSLKFGLHWNHLLYFQSYIHVRKWIFCNHPWMVKLLRIGVLYLNGKVWGVRRCVNCRKALHVYQFPLYELMTENDYSGPCKRTIRPLFYNDCFKHWSLWETDFSTLFKQLINGLNYSYN